MSTTSSSVHIFYLMSVDKAFLVLYSALWLAYDSTIHIWSCYTIRLNTNRLFNPLFDTEANMKRIFGTALVCRCRNKLECLSLLTVQ